MLTDLPLDLMIKYKLSIILFIAICLCRCRPSSSEDVETSKKVGVYLRAAGVIPADSDANKTYIGKIAYVAPGIYNSPHFIFYEITSPEEINKLENAAKKALVEIPEVNKITLHFMEKQVVHKYGNGAMSRNNRKEKEIKKIVLKK